MLTILVLSDGKTWSCTDGASICFIEDKDFETLCQGSSVQDIDPVHEIGLKDMYTND